MRKKKKTQDLRAAQLCPEVAVCSDCLATVLCCYGFYRGRVWTAGQGYGSAVQASCGFPCVFTRRGKWSQNKQESALSVVFPSTPDPAGNEYDLSALSAVRKPWTAVDTSAYGKKRHFYLSVCNPLPYIPGCHGALEPCSAASLGSDWKPRQPFLIRHSCLFRHCTGVLHGVRR